MRAHRLMFWLLAPLILASVAIILRSNARVHRAEAEYPPSGKFVDVAGGRLHVTDKGEGPALILLHGAGGHLRDLDFQLAPALYDKYRVLNFDRPGHGYSDNFDKNGATTELQAALIVQAARKLGVTEATVLGYSFGGSVALTMALDHPKFVRGVVMLAAPSELWPSKSVSTVNTISAMPVIGPIFATILNAVGSEAYFKTQYNEVFQPQSAPDGFFDHVGVLMSLRPRTFHANARQIVSLYDQLEAQIPRYPSLQTPIELVHGTKDNSVPHIYHSDPFSKAAPNVTYTKIDGMGHGVHILAQPEALAALARLRGS